MQEFLRFELLQARCLMQAYPREVQRERHPLQDPCRQECHLRTQPQSARLQLQASFLERGADPENKAKPPEEPTTALADPAPPGGARGDGPPDVAWSPHAHDDCSANNSNDKARPKSPIRLQAFTTFLTTYQRIKSAKGHREVAVKRRIRSRVQVLSPPAVAEDPAKKRKLFLEVCHLVSAWRKSVSPLQGEAEDLPTLDAWTQAEIKVSQRRLEKASRERKENKEMIALGSATKPAEEEKQPPTFAADLADIVNPECPGIRACIRRVLQHVCAGSVRAASHVGCPKCGDVVRPAAKRGGEEASICQQKALSVFTTVLRCKRHSDYTKILATKALLRIGNELPSRWTHIAGAATACLLSPAVTKIGLKKTRRKNDDLREHAKRLLEAAYKKGNAGEVASEAKIQLSAALAAQKKDSDFKVDQTSLAIVVEFERAHLTNPSNKEAAAKESLRQILKELELPPLPDIRIEESEARWERGTALKGDRTDPDTFLMYNCNGIRARWAKGDLERAIADSGYPDFVGLVETKATWAQIQKMPGFIDFLEAQGYTNAVCNWSRNEAKGKHGYAGVMVMTKIRPKSVVFGCKSKKHDEEARTIMAEFKTFGVALAYCPTAGIKEGALAEKLEFENIFRNHCQTQMKRTCKPLFVMGDLNVNPTDGDYHKLAFKNILKRIKASPNQAPPGCSSEERESYHKLLEATKTVSLQRRLHPQANAMTWWPDATGRRNNWGQTLDHILAPTCTLNGDCDVQVEEMRTLQHLAGTSDHCPLWMKLRKTPNRDRNAKMPHIGKYPSQGKQEQIFIATKAGEKFPVALHDRPLVRLSVGGMEQEVMLDTGSFTTIGNPAPGHTPRTDPTFKKAFEAGEDAARDPNKGEPVLRIHGIGGGSLDCNEKGFLQCGPSSKGAAKQIEVAFLPEHVPHMPRLLLGLPTILSAFEGLHIRIPKEGPFKNNLMVTLGAFPDHPLQCIRRCDAIASMFEIKIENERNKQDFREEKLESINDVACLAAARALLVAQKTACRDPSCAACNRKEETLGRRRWRSANERCLQMRRQRRKRPRRRRRRSRLQDARDGAQILSGGSERSSQERLQRSPRFGSNHQPCEYQNRCEIPLSKKRQEQHQD